VTTSSDFSWGHWGERAAWTAVQAFTAVLVVGDASTLRTAAIAGAAALLSALKSLAKARLGS
tara:strand:- start:5737 stop:5922 length:186 start_codon:yes stop_codon:yes gene_type:complete